MSKNFPQPEWPLFIFNTLTSLFPQLSPQTSGSEGHHPLCCSSLTSAGFRLPTDHPHHVTPKICSPRLPQRHGGAGVRLETWF